MSKLNFCVHRGTLVGAARQVPEDLTDWAWEHRSPRTGCNRLVCADCGCPVRNQSGYGVAFGGLSQAAQVYEAEDWSTFDFVERGGIWAQFRMYACRCSNMAERGATPMDRYDNESPRIALPPWACAGHPVVTLPFVFEGREVSAQTPWDQYARDSLTDQWPSQFHGPNPERRAGQVVALYHRLRGTGLAHHVTEAAAALLDAPDSFLRRQIVGVFASLPTAPGSDELRERALNNRSGFSGVPVPQPDEDRDMEMLLVRWAGRRLMSSAGPDPELYEMLQRDAVTAGLGDAVIQSLWKTSPDWVLRHLETIVANSPDAALRLLRLVQWSRRYNEVASRVVAQREVPTEPLRALAAKLRRPARDKLLSLIQTRR